MGIFSKKSNDISSKLMYVDGLDSFSFGIMVKLSLNSKDEYLELESVFKIGKEKPKVYLNYNQVISISLVTEKEVIEQSKSTVGRAVAGGVLLGPVGAIVGGMSGIGNKTKNKTRNFVVINYKSRNGDIKIIRFEVPLGTLSHYKLIENLNDIISPSNFDKKEIYL